MIRVKIENTNLPCENTKIDIWYNSNLCRGGDPENQVDSSELYSSVLTELLYFQTAKYISFISVVFSFLIRN